MAKTIVDRECPQCGGRMVFLTHAGGGAGMVYLIFHCLQCGLKQGFK
jgi:predicted RNA-binding Zn-ribbon protein involved in translation (DUF1610 family)